MAARAGGGLFSTRLPESTSRGRWRRSSTPTPSATWIRRSRRGGWRGWPGSSCRAAPGLFDANIFSRRRDARLFRRDAGAGGARRPAHLPRPVAAGDGEPDDHRRHGGVGRWRPAALARRFTGHTGAALFAGLVFAVRAFRLDHLAHLELQWAFWMPLAFSPGIGHSNTAASSTAWRAASSCCCSCFQHLLRASSGHDAGGAVGRDALPTVAHVSGRSRSGRLPRRDSSSVRRSSAWAPPVCPAVEAGRGARR